MPRRGQARETGCGRRACGSIAEPPRARRVCCASPGLRKLRRECRSRRDGAPQLEDSPCPSSARPPAHPSPRAPPPRSTPTPWDTSPTHRSDSREWSRGSSWDRRARDGIPDSAPRRSQHRPRPHWPGPRTACFHPMRNRGDGIPAPWPIRRCRPWRRGATGGWRGRAAVLRSRSRPGPLGSIAIGWKSNSCYFWRMSIGVQRRGA
mmetsp:Transcript_11336/g.24190  ORF Transcript_11336/g.24190 Transcript_11336/m.24190 type:complete len:206 (-) Transcript_11336:658-1275(-)